MGIIKKAAKKVVKKKVTDPAKTKLKNAGRFITGSDSKPKIKPW
jgi:hypothetical protein